MFNSQGPSRFTVLSVFSKTVRQMARTKQTARMEASKSYCWMMGDSLARETESTVEEHLPQAFEASRQYRTDISQWNNLKMEDFNNQMKSIVQALLTKKTTFDIAFTAIAAQIMHWSVTVDGRECTTEEENFHSSYTLFLLYLVASCVDKKYIQPVPENNEYFQENPLLLFLNEEYLPQLKPEHIRFTFVVDQKEQIQAVHSFICQLFRGEAVERLISGLILSYADYFFAPFFRKINRLMEELDVDSLVISSDCYPKVDFKTDSNELTLCSILPHLLECDVFIKQNNSGHPFKYLSDCLLFELMFTGSTQEERYHDWSEFLKAVPICLYPEEFIGIVEETFRMKNMSTDLLVKWFYEYFMEFPRMDSLFCYSMVHLRDCRKPFFSKLLAALEVTWSKIIKPYLKEDRLIMVCAFVDLLRSIIFFMELQKSGNKNKDLKKLIQRSEQLCKQMWIATDCVKKDKLCQQMTEPMSLILKKFCGTEDASPETNCAAKKRKFEQNLDELSSSKRRKQNPQ